MYKNTSPTSYILQKTILEKPSTKIPIKLSFPETTPWSKQRILHLIPPSLQQFFIINKFNIYLYTFVRHRMSRQGNTNNVNGNLELLTFLFKLPSHITSRQLSLHFVFNSPNHESNNNGTIELSESDVYTRRCII